MRRFILKYSIAITLCFLSFQASLAQTFSYTSGSLSVDVFVSHPCNGMTDNGFLRFDILSVDAGAGATGAVILLVDGPNEIFFPSGEVPVGSSFTYTPPGPQAGDYDFVIRDNRPSGSPDVINTPPGGPPFGVTLNNLPTIVLNQVTLTNNANCVTPNGQVEVSLTGGSRTPALAPTPGSFDYTWSSDNGLAGLPLNGTYNGTGSLDLAALLSRPGLPAGTYTLLVDDAYSTCTQSADFIIADPSPLTFNVSSLTPAVCLGSTGTIRLDNSEGGSVSYEIYLGTPPTATATGIIQNGNSGVLDFTIPTSILNAAGSYDFSIRAVNGVCTPAFMNGVGTIVVNPVSTASVLSGTATICSGSSTNLVVTITGGVGPFDVTYFDGTSNQVVNGYVSGSNIAVSPTITTTYSLVSVVDANGCVGIGLSGTATVTVNQPSTASVLSGTATICSGSSTNLVVTITGGVGPFEVTYNDGTSDQAVNNYTSGTNIAVNPTATATYTLVSVVDNNNCPGTGLSGTATVTVNPTSTASVLSGTATICSGASTNLVVTITGGTGPFDVTYFDGTSNQVVNGYVSGSNIAVSPTVTTTYSLVSVVDANGCVGIGLSGTATVTVNQPSTASVLSGTATICSGSSTNLVVTITGGTGPFDVTYFDGTSNQVVNGYVSGSNIAVNPTVTTTYSLVSVVDANGCVGIGLSGTATVTVNQPSTASVLSGTVTICSGSSTNLVLTITGGTGPFDVTYFDGTSNQVVNGYVSGSNIAVSPTTTTTYSLVSVVDANNCAGTGLSGTATVTVNPTSTASVLSGTATICSGSSTNLVVTITGGTGPFDVTYFDGTSNQVVNGYVSGSNIAVNPTVTTTYSLVSVVDANGCVGIGLSGTATVTVNQPSTASVLSGTATICSGSSTNLVVTITGGTGPFDVTYFDGTSNQVVNGYVSGTDIAVSPTVTTTYSLVSVVDANGCVGIGLSGTATVTVNQPSTASALSGTATICSGASTNLVVTITGGTGPFDITYFDGTSNQVVNGYVSGSNIAVSPTVTTTYSLVSVVDANGCVGIGLSGTATVTVNQPSTASVLSGTATICSGSSTNLVVTITGGTGPFDITYFDGTSNQVVNGYVSGSNIAVSPTVTTTYSLVSVVDANGCVGIGLSGTATVTVNQPSTASVLSGTATICSGSSTNLVVTITGGTGPFDVTYFDGTSNQVVNGYVSGSNIAVSPTVTTTYSLVSVVDANGCVGIGLSGTATVTVNQPSTASVLSGTATICSGASTNLVVTITGGTGPFDVTYFDGTSNQVVNGYVSGSNIAVSPTVTTTYSLVSVVDANGCVGIGLSGTATVTVNQPSTASVLSGTATICSGSSTNLVVTITGGTGPFDVTYGTSNQVVNGYVSGTDIAVSPTVTTTYSLVSVVDANGCVGIGLSGTATVTVNQPSTASVLSGTATICSGSSTNLVVTITGGTGPFAVTYFDGTSNQVVNGYVSGTDIAVSPTVTTTYSLVSVVDANGCVGIGLSGTATVTVNQPSAASVLSGTATICSGSSTNLVVTITGGTGPFDVTYFDGTSNQVVNGYVSGSNIAVSPTVTTTYSLVSVVDANGCVGIGLSGTATVTVNQPSTASVLSGTATICSGSSTNLVVTITGGTGPFDVTYFDGTSNQVVNGYVSGTDIAVSPTVTTTYSLVSVVDANGCVGIGLSGTATVTVNQPSTASVLSGTATICSGSSTNLVVTITGGTGPFDVTYFDGTSNQVVNGYVSGSNIAVSPTVTTTYSLVSVVDANGCVGIGLSGTATVTVNQPSTASALSGTATICSGSSTNLVVTITGGTGPFDVTYFDGTSNQVVNGYVSGSNIAVSPTVTTTYSLVSVVDANGCVGIGLSGTATVTINTLPSITSATPTHVTACVPGNDGSITITATGGDGNYEYSINNGGSYQVGNTFNGLVAGSYFVIVRDGIGCLSGTSNVTINSPSNLAASAIATNAICNGDSNGEITITASGGSGVYSYSIDNGLNFQPSSIFSGLPPGNYTIITKDDNDCTFSTPETITEPTIVSFTTSQIDPTCNGTPDGSITVTAIGGNSSFTYSIDASSFQASNIFSNLNDATYSIQAQDGNGCLSAPSNVTLTAPTAITSSATTTDVTTCAPGNEGSITVTASGGTGVLEYSLDGVIFQTSNTFNSLIPGPYNVTVQDGNSCQNTALMVTINNVASTPDATFNGLAPIYCETNGAVTLSPVTVGGTFTGPGISGNTFDPSIAGVGSYSIQYTVTTSGCSNSSNQPVEVSSSAIDASFSGLTSTVCISSGTLTLTPATAGGTFSGPGVSGNMFDPSVSGAGSFSIQYDITIGGCSNSSSQPVTVISNSVDASFSGLNIAYCTSSSAVTLTPVTAGGIFSGPGITGDQFDPSSSGTGIFSITYSVTSGGCTSSTSQSVAVVPSTDPFCSGVVGTGDCATVSITPKPSPASCTNSDGNIVFSIKPFFPIVNNIGVVISITGISITNQSISRTNFNDSTFLNLPVGTYDYSIEYGDPGCIKTGQVTIDQSGTVGTPVITSIINPVCPGQPSGSFSINVTGELGNVLEYSLDGITWNQFIVGNQVNSIPAGPSPTFQHTVSVRRNSSDPCYGAAVVTMQDQTSPINATITSQNATCLNNDGSIQLNAVSGGLSPYSYRLNGGATSPVPPSTVVDIPNLIAGVYTLTITDGNNCNIDNPITISFPGPPIPVDFKASASSEICFQQNGGINLSEITGALSTSYTYEILKAGNLFQTSAITALQALGTVNLTGIEPGEYQIKLMQNQSQCVDPIESGYKTIMVTGPSSALDTISVERGISYPEQGSGFMKIIVDESGVEPYEYSLELTEPLFLGQNYFSDWSQINNNIETGKFETVANDLFAGIYTLSLRDGLGCTKDFVIVITADAELFIPNIFTPNGDANNEEFYIRNLPPNSTVMITDRWGKQIYFSSDYKNDWNGGDSPEGVYYYKISLNDKTLSGWVEILRGTP